MEGGSRGGRVIGHDADSHPVDIEGVPLPGVHIVRLPDDATALTSGWVPGAPQDTGRGAGTALARGAEDMTIDVDDCIYCDN